MNKAKLVGIWVIGMLFLTGTATAADAELKTENEKIFYYLGTSLSVNLAPLNLSDEELALVQRGMTDAISGDAVVLDAAVYGEKLNEIAQERMTESAAREEATASAYVQSMAEEEGATTTDSGVVILVLTEGTGDSPTADSTVTAHYHGTLRDGTVFDSSVDRGEPFTASLGKVIPCWREAIPTMQEGGKSKITCPSDVAYGPRGSGAIPGGAALTFEVELIEVVD